MQRGMRFGQPRFEAYRFNGTDQNRVVFQRAEFDSSADACGKLLLELAPIEAAVGGVQTEASQRRINRLADRAPEPRATLRVTWRPVFDDNRKGLHLSLRF